LRGTKEGQKRDKRGTKEGQERGPTHCSQHVEYLADLRVSEDVELQGNIPLFTQTLLKL